MGIESGLLRLRLLSLGEETTVVMAVNCTVIYPNRRAWIRKARIPALVPESARVPVRVLA